ncbi:MAG: FAD-dependent oxidoreductase [Spirochaetota bacterium]
MSAREVTCDVLIVGGGAGGVCAAIAAAELGAKVVVTEETGWIGGMLTAAGVSAIDGNHTLPSGLWGRFRSRLRDHYGGAGAVETGWISHTLFEPHVAQAILRDMLEQTGATLLTGHRCTDALIGEGRSRAANSGIAADVHAVRGGVFEDTGSGDQLRVEAGLTVAADEYGDFVYLAGLPFRIGLEGRATTGEPWAPENPYPVPQDLTYVATLSAPNEATLPDARRPGPGDPPRWLPSFPRILEGTDHSWRDFFSYARLPGDLFMLNWPIRGNDYHGDYLGLRLDASVANGPTGSTILEGAAERSARLRTIRRSREKVLASAKKKTLLLVKELQEAFPAAGIRIAADVYPTEDGLPLLPYIREARRIMGEATLTLNEITDPYGGSALYRRAIAVGNYPVDHHRLEDPEAPSIDFPAIPSFSIPVDALIPRGVIGLLAAEKSISVSGMANGCTRLHPVAMELGEAAGVLAALATGSRRARQSTKTWQDPGDTAVADPRNVPVQTLQEVLLSRECMLMPCSDATSDDPDFRMLQRAGISGILRGTALSVDWENHMLLRPDEPATTDDLDIALSESTAVPKPRASTLRRRLYGEVADGAMTRRGLARMLLNASPAPRRFSRT